MTFTSSNRFYLKVAKQKLKSFKAMRETIALLRKNVPQNLLPRAYLIGGRVDDLVCKDMGADHWTNDGMKGVRLCQKIMGKN